MGGRLEKKKIENLEGFSSVVVAAGAGSEALVGQLPVSLIKGQVLLADAGEISLPSHSLVGKGYVAIEGSQVCVGSTYERSYTSASFDEEVARSLILRPMKQFFEDVDALTIVGGRAAIRVCVKGHYFPIIKKIKTGVWVVTGLGSRGLLYHALIGKKAAEEITG
jgi:glycine/D-amino acid oxidase-like deaminating enzyme